MGIYTNKTLYKENFESRSGYSYNAFEFARQRITTTIRDDEIKEGYSRNFYLTQTKAGKPTIKYGNNDELTLIINTGEGKNDYGQATSNIYIPAIYAGNIKGYSFGQTALISLKDKSEFVFFAAEKGESRTCYIVKNGYIHTCEYEKLNETLQKYNIKNLSFEDAPEFGKYVDSDGKIKDISLKDINEKLRYAFALSPSEDILKEMPKVAIDDDVCKKAAEEKLPFELLEEKGIIKRLEEINPKLLVCQYPQMCSDNVIRKLSPDELYASIISITINFKPDTRERLDALISKMQKLNIELSLSKQKSLVNDRDSIQYDCVLALCGDYIQQIQDEDELVNLIKNNPNVLDMRKADEEIIEKAIRKSANSHNRGGITIIMKFNPLPEYALKAFLSNDNDDRWTKENIELMKRVEHPSKEFIDFFVKRVPLSLQEFPQTEDLQIIAVTSPFQKAFFHSITRWNNDTYYAADVIPPEALVFSTIENPSEQVIKAALDHTPQVLKLIKDSNVEQCLIAWNSKETQSSSQMKTMLFSIINERFDGKFPDVITDAFLQHDLRTLDWLLDNQDTLPFSKETLYEVAIDTDIGRARHIKDFPKHLEVDLFKRLCAGNGKLHESLKHQAFAEYGNSYSDRKCGFLMSECKYMGIEPTAEMVEIAIDAGEMDFVKEAIVETAPSQSHNACVNLSELHRQYLPDVLSMMTGYRLADYVEKDTSDRINIDMLDRIFTKNPEMAKGFCYEAYRADWQGYFYDKHYSIFHALHIDDNKTEMAFLQMVASHDFTAVPIPSLCENPEELSETVIANIYARESFDISFADFKDYPKEIQSAIVCNIEKVSNDETKREIKEFNKQKEMEELAILRNRTGAMSLSEASRLLELKEKYNISAAEHDGKQALSQEDERE